MIRGIFGIITSRPQVLNTKTQTTLLLILPLNYFLHIPIVSLYFDER